MCRAGPVTIVPLRSLSRDSGDVAHLIEQDVKGGENLGGMENRVGIARFQRLHVVADNSTTIPANSDPTWERDWETYSTS